MYGLSVLLKNPQVPDQGEESYLVHHLPWLIGSLGTLTLDLIVSFYKMEKKKENTAAAMGPLGCLQSHIHGTF